MAGAVTLSTKHTVCFICKTGIVMTDREPTQVVIYGRHGPRLAYHQYSRCNCRNVRSTCRAGYYHGFTQYKGARIYDDDVLKNEVFVVTRRTCFDLDYLIELVGLVDVSHEHFRAAATRYNRFHQMKLPTDVMQVSHVLFTCTIYTAVVQARVEMHYERLIHGYYLFCYLEICQRYGITNYQIIKHTLHSAILEHKADLMKTYRRRWSVHTCDVIGCRTVMVIDAG